MVHPRNKQHDVQVSVLATAMRYLLINTLVLNNSMVGALNKLPVAASGMLFFGDAVTFGSVSAVLVGFLAGIVYAVAKINQKRVESARNQANAIIPLTHRKP